MADQKPSRGLSGWFPDGAKSHQRGYTLVNADRAAGTVDIDFAMHEGQVTLLGSNFTLPDPAPAGYVLVGDTASLPAINALLGVIGDTPARVFLETAHDDDRELPVAKSDVTWIDRKNAGEALVEAVGSSAFDAADHCGWVACDNGPPARWRRSSARTTRSRASPSRPRRTGWPDVRSRAVASAPPSAGRTPPAWPVRRRRRALGTPAARSSRAPPTWPAARRPRERRCPTSPGTPRSAP
jgi:Siderophore-interacting protein/Siderophore-interacting FAD-binding domain